MIFLKDSKVTSFNDTEEGLEQVELFKGTLIGLGIIIGCIILGIMITFTLKYIKRDYIIKNQTRKSIVSLENDNESKQQIQRESIMKANIENKDPPLLQNEKISTIDSESLINNENINNLSSIHSIKVLFF